KQLLQSIWHELVLDLYSKIKNKVSKNGALLSEIQRIDQRLNELQNHQNETRIIQFILQLKDTRDERVGEFRTKLHIIENLKTIFQSLGISLSEKLDSFKNGFVNIHVFTETQTHLHEIIDMLRNFN